MITSLFIQTNGQYFELNIHQDRKNVKELYCLLYDIILYTVDHSALQLN